MPGVWGGVNTQKCILTQKMYFDNKTRISRRKKMFSTGLCWHPFVFTEMCVRVLRQVFNFTPINPSHD